MSQTTRATVAFGPDESGRIWNVFGSGVASTSLSWTRREAVDRRAVEGHPLVERALQLGRGDREGLRDPENVGEPELDELHAALFDGAKHVLALALHSFLLRRRATVAAVFSQTPGKRATRRTPPVTSQVYRPVTSQVGTRAVGLELRAWAACASRSARSTRSSATSRATLERVLAALEVASSAEADLAVFPELVLTGYPPEDLLLKPSFIAANKRALDDVAAATASCVAVVGFVDAVGRRSLQRRRGLCQRQHSGHLAQGAAPELRRLRRAALVHARDGRHPALPRRRRPRSV